MRLLLLVLVFSLAVQQVSGQSATPYFPPAHSWQRMPPAEAGMSATKLAELVAYAQAQESAAPRNMEISQAQTFGKEPFGEGTGPFETRGDPTGLVIRRGYVVAEWGDPLRCDMAHSVTKSFLSTVVGLAVDRQLIRNVQDSVAPYVPPIELYTPAQVQRPAELLGTPELLRPFDSPHNRSLSWDHMLRQTSDWEGTLWGKPEWADRPSATPADWQTRARQTPGSVYEYNDVRVNALALAATSVWRRPLPQVLKELIMDPIGASNTWRWTGYRNSWIVLDGQAVQAVSGGGHWGGGMFIHAYDMARYGLLTMHKGRWNGRQLLSEQWIRQATTPTKAQPTYGYMNFFLNTDKKFLPSAPELAFVHIGNGTNMIYVDPEHELVMVVRWIDNKAMDGVVKKLLESMTK
ncbi:serine hydrolase domain-containing protein [Arundinibacter roseus]|uniref:Class C beta-lactamase-related serine hydrolase n=1 Tax=Arundinibacter roseus TaxID=2070510 RepID=A0A4R4K735_9BACT|nr:serine hydrolase [Arundinibacter roseus]TDB63357.1 class C beta-lactamase-related serine hydrolase [Arundinibacter roseus]